MKKIGFIGAQSLHSVYFGEVLSSGVAGLASSSGRLWAPDTPELALMRLVQGELSEGCNSLEELLEKSDAVMILLRDGNSHRELAERCLKAGKPVFVDKPFTCTPEDAGAIIACAEKHAIPLMGGSTLCWLPETKQVAALAKDAEEITISFAADWDSPYGGWYYYGSHLTDLCAAVAGCGPLSVSARRTGRNVEALVTYPGLNVRLCSNPELKDLRFLIKYKNGKSSRIIVHDYERCYRLGMERFSRMLQTGKSVHTERLLFSTQLLQSIIQSILDDEAEISEPTG